MPTGRTVRRALCALTVVVMTGTPAYAAGSAAATAVTEVRAVTADPAVVATGTAPATVAVAAHVVAPAAAETVRLTVGAASAALQLTGGDVRDGTWSGVVTIPAFTPYGALPAVVDVTDATASTTTASLPALTVADSVPAAPASVTASAANGTLRVGWTPPPANGGSAVTAYDVAAQPLTAGVTAPAPLVTGTDARSAAFEGLPAGRYAVRVAARNAAGAGPAATADATTETGVVTVPDGPTGVAVTPGDGALTVTWTPPASDGGSPLAGYDVTALPRTGTAAAVTSLAAGAIEATLTGLANGVAYDVTVAARNAAGPSRAATATATPRTVPAAPAVAALVAHDGAVDVSWTPPADDGGAPVLSYAVAAAPSGVVVTVPAAAGFVTVGRLANGTAATFTVFAVNAAGAGPASVPRTATPRVPARLSVVTEPATPVPYRTASVVGASLETVAGLAVSGERIELVARVRPSTSWRVVASGTTGDDGRVTLRAVLPATSALRLRHRAGVADAPEVGVRSVTVAARVNALPSASRIRLGQSVTVRGAVAPAHPVGTAVRLQRYSGGAWRTVASGRLTTTTSYRVTWRPPAAGSPLVRVVLPAHSDHATGVSARWTQRVEREAAADVARAILADGGIRLERVHASGIGDLATARHNVVDVANGRLARRSAYQNAPGGYTAIDLRLLRALRRMGERGTVTVSEIAGGSHARGSAHYYGRGLDINYVNGRHVGPGSGYGMAVEVCRAYGATRVYSPGYDPYGGHWNHVHCEW